MDKKISTIIQKYADSEILLDKVVVSSCCHYYGIETGNGYLSKFVPQEQDQLAEDIELLAGNCNIENVINIFEQAIPQAEKTTNGAVYTPKYIRDYIVEQTFKNQSKPVDGCLCADIACGCGAFLYRRGSCPRLLRDRRHTPPDHHLHLQQQRAVAVGRRRNQSHRLPMGWCGYQTEMQQPAHRYHLQNQQQ